MPKHVSVIISVSIIKILCLMEENKNISRNKKNVNYFKCRL